MTPPLQPPGPPSSISRSCSGKCCCLLELRLRFQPVPLGLCVTDMFVCSVLPARMWSSTFDGTPPRTHTQEPVVSFCQPFSMLQLCTCCMYLLFTPCFCSVCEATVGSSGKNLHLQEYSNKRWMVGALCVFLLTDLMIGFISAPLFSRRCFSRLQKIHIC